MYSVIDVHNYALSFANGNVLIMFQGSHKIDNGDTIEYTGKSLIIHRKRNVPLRFCNLLPCATEMLDEIDKSTSEVYVSRTVEFGVDVHNKLMWC